MTLPESETVDHHRKREKKTLNTDNHNTIKLKQPTQLERAITIPKKQLRAQHKTPHRSKKNQAMDKEV